MLADFELSRGVNIHFRKSARVVVYSNSARIISKSEALQAIGRSNRRKGRCEGTVLVLMPPNSLTGEEGNSHDADSKMQSMEIDARNTMAPLIAKTFFQYFNSQSLEDR